MGNIITYAENALLPMDISPLSAADSLILSELSYIDFEGIVGKLGSGTDNVVIRELSKTEYFNKMFARNPLPDNCKMLLYAAAASPRFRNIEVNYYTNIVDADSEKQFSAVTFFLEDGTAYVAFRGTDTTLVGWKEDFNMGFSAPVPSQEESRKYLNRVAELCDKKISVGGHSKGGNLAIYAAMFCDENVQKRLLGAYSHDGPGFLSDMLDGGVFEKIRPIVHKTIPRSSLVGMLMETQDTYDIVESDGFWINQHNPFTWIIDGDDFRYTENISGGASYFNYALNKWIENSTSSQREVFADTLCLALDASKAESSIEFVKNWRRTVPGIISAMSDMDPETKKALHDIMREIASLAVHHIDITEHLPKNLGFLKRKKQS